MDVTNFSPGNTFAIIYGKNIRAQILTPVSGFKETRFFGCSGPNSFADGDTVFRQSEPGREMFYIKRGAVRVSIGGYDIAALGQGEIFGEMSFHAKESRFHFDVTRKLDNGKTLKAYVELDFLLSGQGDERISNSFNPRLRQFYFSYGKWLLGQTWSTFQIAVQWS